MEKKYKRVSTKGLAKKYNFKAYPEPFGIWFRSCIQGAMRRDLDFSLTVRQAYDLSQYSCYYCGRNRVSVIDGFRYNGIDRVKNTDGYHQGNVVTCCKTCNAMKGKLSLVEFIEQAKRIVDNGI